MNEHPALCEFRFWFSVACNCAAVLLFGGLVLVTPTWWRLVFLVAFGAAVLGVALGFFLRTLSELQELFSGR